MITVLSTVPFRSLTDGTERAEVGLPLHAKQGGGESSREKQSDISLEQVVF